MGRILQTNGGGGKSMLVVVPTGSTTEEGLTTGLCSHTGWGVRSLRGGRCYVGPRSGVSFGDRVSSNIGQVFPVSPDRIDPHIDPHAVASGGEAASYLI